MAPLSLLSKMRSSIRMSPTTSLISKQPSSTLVEHKTDHGPNSPHQPGAISLETIPATQAVPALYKECERLATFRDWPSTFLSPKQMAKAGFYYLNRGDVVRCIFCGVEVGWWEEGDDPLVDHKKWSPACKFIRCPRNVGNVPIEDDSSADENADGYDTCGPYGVIPSVNTSRDEPLNLENLGVQKSHPPSFPAYSTYESRLNSYKSWPISLKLKPDMLSEAGFFYTGEGDKTICFHCGGGLKDWEDTDEPWVEHARWFSKCSFILLMKGKDFVDEVSGKKLLQNLKDNSLKGRGLSSSTSDLEIPSKHSEIPSTSKGESSGGDVSMNSSSSKSGSCENDAGLCKICFMNEVGVVFLPCGHLVACVRCAASLTTCAVCRKPFTATIRAYLS